MIPQIDNSIDNTNLINEVILPSRTYRLSSNYETQIKYGDTQNIIGENIMLTDAAEVKVKKLDVKGNTKQFNTTGKNLFNAQIQAGTYGRAIYSVARDGLITQSASDNSEWITTQTRNFYLDAGTYTINCIGKGTEKRLQIHNLTDDVDIIQTQSEKGTFTLTERKLLGMKTWGSSAYPARYYVQIEKGSEATTYEPYTGGIASPNPEYPQDIEVVSGSNVVNTSNKNLMDKDREISQGSTNNSTDTTRVSIRVKHKLKANTTYTVITNLNTSNFNWAFVLGTKVSPLSNAEQLYDSGWKNTNYWSYTTSQECYINIPIRKPSNADININDVKDYWFMLYEGAYDSSISYEPHQGKELPLDLPVENLMALTNSTNTDSGITRVIENGVIKLNGTPQSTSYNNTILTFTATKTGQYMLLPYKSSTNSNIRFIYKINDGSFINNDNNLTMNLTKNDVVAINLRISSTDRINNFTLKPMLYLGTKVNAFYPYGTEPIELCKIGDYQDYFYKSGSKWYLHKETFKTIIPSSVIGTMQNRNKRFFVNKTQIGNYDILKTSSISQTFGLYCDILKEVTAGQTWTGTQGISYDYNASSGTVGFDFSISGLTTVAEYQEALAGKIIIAKLNTPTNTEITNTTLISQLEDLQKAKAYQGTTYIYTIANEISPILDIDYYPLSSIYYETAQVDRISGFIDDKDAIKQVVYHILSIERYSCLIYDDNYGVELQQYIGQDFEYLKVTIQKTLEEALMQDERIISIEVIDIEKINNETANVKLSIQANVGEIQMEVNVNV